jgi:hypothetical protein
MQILNHAWTTLRDSAGRRRYDRLLARQSVSAGAGGRSASARTATRPSRHSQEAPRRPQLGPGYQYWFGAALAGKRANGRAALNLRVTGSSLADLSALLPDGLVGLRAANAPIDDTQLRSLQGMTSLRYLDLTGTGITDAGLVHILACSNLETLILWDTGVTDDGVALLAGFHHLRHLGLGNTRVTDSGLRHLGGLRRLRLVQLSGTEVEGQGLKHLHGLPELTTVSLPWKVRGSHRRRLKSALPPTALVI